MKALVARSPIGLFAFSENGQLLYYKLWPKVNAIENFLSIHMDKDFTSNLSGYQVIENDLSYKMLRKNIRDYAKSLEFVKSDVELNEFLSSFSVALSKRRLQGFIGRDRLIVQAVRTLDDLTRSINVFMERLFEWYSLHYPEMKNINVVDLIAKHGRRENVPGFRSSVGVDLEDDDEKALKDYAETIKSLEKQKKDLEHYVSSAMKSVAPNFSSLVDPILAARLLAAAGSLEKLARMTASTIQLLGAEKALFRHLKQQGRSPKYGIIYNSSLIQNAPNEHKGKVARILSSKLMLAARIDYFSGRNDSQKMKSEMMANIEKVKR